MGCRYSLSNGDGNPNLFNVYNVDDQGQELTSGKIEVCETELVLYQKKKEPIKWPLRCLRRYGFDAELFSFESGRRCPTGSGIYAFKCRRAEALFNLLQECIHRAGQEEQRYNTPAAVISTSRNNSLAETSYLTPNVPSALAQIEPADSNGNDAGHHYINGDIAHEYVNSAISTLPRRKSSTDDENADVENIDMDFNDPEEILVDVCENGGDVNYTMLDLPQGAVSVRKNSCESRQSFESHSAKQAGAYMNIDVLPNDLTVKKESAYINMSPEGVPVVGYSGIQQNGIKRKGKLLSKTIHRQSSFDQHGYANFSMGGSFNNSLNKGRNSLPNSRKVNYIQLDLEQHIENGAVGGCLSVINPVTPNILVPNPESPTQKVHTEGGEGYAMIDFDKTVALSNTAKASDDEGSRKTRHS